MSEPREVEVWPCGYVAKCSVPWCRQRATTILRYLDKQGRPYRQVDVCKTQRTEQNLTSLSDLRVLSFGVCAADRSWFARSRPR
jgi:hypothetical protein